MEIFEISKNDIPKDVIEAIGKSVFDYSITIISIGKKGSIGEQYIGSGTLVSTGKSSGIITAGHVAEKLDGSGMGLVLKHKPTKFIIPRNYLDIQLFSEPGSSEEQGPDLAFIKLPNSSTYLETIRASKVFMDFGNRRELFAQGLPDRSQGLWILCGCPDEFTVNRDRITSGFDEELGYGPLLFSPGRICKEYPKVSHLYNKTFDYLEIEVPITKGEKIPMSFGGVSGGGLWQVPLVKKCGHLTHGKPFLSGVAFYQFPLTNSSRSIKLHGVDSIYSHLFSLIK